MRIVMLHVVMLLLGVHWDRLRVRRHRVVSEASRVSGSSDVQTG